MELTLDQALMKGIEAHKAGNLEEADRYYTAILKVQPNHPDANHNMGVLAVGVGKVEQALPFFKKALDANPSIDQFWLSYIDALIKLNRMDDAKAVFDEAKSKGLKGDGFEKIEKRLGLYSKSQNDSKDPEESQVNILDKKQRKTYVNPENHSKNISSNFSVGAFRALTVERKCPTTQVCLTEKETTENARCSLVFSHCFAIFLRL